MPHGLPDYGVYQAKTTTFGLSDMGELAARLGSIVTYDRRGDVVWFCDCEGNEEIFDTAIVGVGAGVVQSSEQAHNGSFSMKLTTGNNIGDFATILKRYQYPVMGLFGLEAAFTVNVNVNNIELRITVNTGTRQLQAGVRLNYANSRLEYYNSAGAWAILAAGITTTALATMFYQMKVVCDLVNEVYVRLIFAGVEYDMSTLSFLGQNIVGAPIMVIHVLNFTNAAANESVYIDNVIVTQNEP